MSPLRLFGFSGKTVGLTGGGLGEQMRQVLADAESDAVVFPAKLIRCEELAHKLEEQYEWSTPAVQCEDSNEREVEEAILQPQ